MSAAEKRKLIAIMLFTVLLAGGAFCLRETRLTQSRVLSTPPETVSIARQRQEITVEVSGAVILPGIYRLPPGSRVQDAVEQAGGLLPEADRKRINLDRLCTDGTRINIHYLKTGRRPPSKGPISINSAGAAELTELPGIGPELAKRIVAYREKHGPFKTISQLKDVSGIGEGRFAQIKDLVKL